MTAEPIKASNHALKINVSVAKHSVDERAAEALKNVAESIKQNGVTIQRLADAMVDNAHAARDYLRFFNANQNVTNGVADGEQGFTNALKQAS